MKKAITLATIIFLCVYILPSCGGNSTNESTSSSSNLYFSYDFDESSGTTVFDSSDNSFDGVLQGCSRVSGKIDNGIEFNFQDAHIDIHPKFGNLEVNGYMNTFSVDYWIYPYEINTDKTYFIIGGYNYYEFSMEIVNGKIVIMCDGVTYLTSQNQLTPNNWTYISYAYDGTTMRLYVNGVEDCNKNITFVTSQTVGVGYTIGSRKIYQPSGNSLFGYTDDFVGVIDEFHFWETALTSQFVSTEYNNTK